MPVIAKECVAAMQTLFERTTYKHFTPRVEIAHGTFILTRSGALFPSLKWTLRLLYRSPVAFTRTFILSVLSAVKRGWAPPKDETKQYGVIHSCWTAGYYHWLTESLPRAYLLKKVSPEAIPLIPSSKYLAYAQSLRAIGHESFEMFPLEKNIKLHNPIITECPHKFATTAPALLREVREAVIGYFDLTVDQSVDRSKNIIYVSRLKARGRRVVNEDEVIERLAMFHAQVVYFEDLTFGEQVELMQSAGVLISIHGAALTNMMFMPTGSKVLELIPRKNFLFDYNSVRNSFKHDSCYVRLADVFKHEYYCLECPAQAPWFSATHMADIIVDVEKIGGLVAKMVAQ